MDPENKMKSALDKAADSAGKFWPPKKEEVKKVKK